MNVDGSGKTQLTTDVEWTDGAQEPTWIHVPSRR
jgi:hypothetical protein